MRKISFFSFNHLSPAFDVRSASSRLISSAFIMPPFSIRTVDRRCTRPLQPRWGCRLCHFLLTFLSPTLIYFQDFWGTKFGEGKPYTKQGERNMVIKQGFLWY